MTLCTMRNDVLFALCHCFGRKDFVQIYTHNDKTRATNGFMVFEWKEKEQCWEVVK